MNFDDEQRRNALFVQEVIAKAAKEAPPDSRLDAVEQHISEALSAIHETRAREFPRAAEAIAAKEKLLREIESIGRRIGESSKGWREFKERGRRAPSPALQPRFDELWQMCAIVGLFINPEGELESMLVDCGIKTTTDKKGWISQALQLLPELELNDGKSPWKFLKSIQQHAFGED